MAWSWRIYGLSLFESIPRSFAFFVKNIFRKPHRSCSRLGYLEEYPLWGQTIGFARVQIVVRVEVIFLNAL